MNPFLLSAYQTRRESILIDPLRIELLRITNIDELYDKLIQKGSADEAFKDERIPYWCDLWPSAIALSEHLIKSNITFQGKSVLEIGCGLALPGIVAGKLGAHVTFTDYLTEALDFAKQNWKLNNHREANFNLLDWRKPNPLLSADIVLASDIVYEKRSFEDVLNAFHVLVNTNGVILMSEPNRAYTKVFFDSLNNNGFVYSTHHYHIHLNQLTTKVNVYEIRRWE